MRTEEGAASTPRQAGGPRQGFSLEAPMQRLGGDLVAPCRSGRTQWPWWSRRSLPAPAAPPQVVQPCSTAVDLQPRPAFISVPGHLSDAYGCAHAGCSRPAGAHAVKVCDLPAAPGAAPRRCTRMLSASQHGFCPNTQPRVSARTCSCRAHPGSVLGSEAVVAVATSQSGKLMHGQGRRMGQPGPAHPMALTCSNYDSRPLQVRAGCFFVPSQPDKDVFHPWQGKESLPARTLVIAAVRVVLP